MIGCASNSLAAFWMMMDVNRASLLHSTLPIANGSLKTAFAWDTMRCFSTPSKNWWRQQTYTDRWVLSPSNRTMGIRYPTLPIGSWTCQQIRSPGNAFTLDPRNRSILFIHIGGCPYPFLILSPQRFLHKIFNRHQFLTVQPLRIDFWNRDHP